MHRDITELLTASENKSVVFQQVIDTIRRHYECTPVAFTTGAGGLAPVYNAAGTNAASSQLLAFARRLGLSDPQTLDLYAEHYRAVLANPQGSDHANIRALMAGGLAGVRWEEEPLRLRGPALQEPLSGATDRP